MKVLPFEMIGSIISDDYVVLRFNGLFGDMLFGMCKLQHVLQMYPDNPWIVVHDYGSFDRVQAASEFFEYWFKLGRLKYYFYNYRATPGPIRSEDVDILLQHNIPKKQIFDCLVFQQKPRILTPPDIGISIPARKNKSKAVIFRYSGYHSHFFSRNRPVNEWELIEKKLLDSGYTVYLLGSDDIMSVSPNIIDLRNQFTVKEVLNFVKDAGICITVTTFLYIWTQFICPTAVLTAQDDEQNLNHFWKINPNMKTFSVETKSYLDDLYAFIDHVRGYNEF